jgi:acetolactate synthase I/II/III large subunit
MTRMTGGQAVVEMLRRHGVNTLFALPGVQNDALFSALYDAGGAVRVVHTRHEQGAAYMAYGYAKSTGGVGAYAVVPGPGVLNTTAALATAYAANARVLCLSGQIATHMIGRGWGMLHEIPDQFAILRGLTKWAARAEHPTQVPALLDEAFHQLYSGRPRPVALEIPMDVLALETDVTLTAGQTAASELAPDAQAIEQAAAMLAKAAQPLIMLGSGADDAGAEVLAVAELLQAPVVSVSNGRGVVSDQHYLGLHGPGGHRLWKAADVVLAVGTRMQRAVTGWGVDDALKIIHIDIDPLELGRIHPPTLGIVADARPALAALRAALARQLQPRPSREAELNALKEELDEEFAQIKPQYEFIRALRDALPDDGILVDEMTQVGYASRYAFPIYRPRTLITSNYQGTLGYGFASALGVKVAHPDQPVLSINGDGGFMYNVQELSTAVLHGINLVTVVFSDNAFGNVLRMQKELYGGRVIASNLHNPDFARLAEDFGAVGMHARDPQELRTALRKAFGLNKPVLIEVPVGEMPDPRRFTNLPRVRGKA